MNGNGHGVPSSPSIAVPLGNGGLRGRIVGVTRIGARAGLIAAGILAALVLAIVYGISQSGDHRAAATFGGETPQILPTTGPLYGDVPGANATPPALGAATPAAPATSLLPVVATHVIRGNPNASVPVLPDGASGTVDTNRARSAAPASAPDVPALQRLAATPFASAPLVDAVAAVRAERRRAAAQLAEAARRSAILVASTDGTAPTRVAIDDAARGAVVSPTTLGTPAPVATPDPNADPAVASQRAKVDFLKLQRSTTASDYLAAPRQNGISPYEVQAGAIIPAVMVSGINSDLPGTMVGQVSEDVYDSKTGRILLIPAGSKLVGTYDSQVVNGQSRVLVAWRRLLFPDASFIDIGGMAGADAAGYAGLTGKVDDHSGKLFRNALLFSLIGAGSTLLQPHTAIAALTPGGVVQQVGVGAQIANQVGQQIAQLASQATNRGLNQQPTIEVRPGTTFNVVVDRDLVLPGAYAR